MTQFYRLLPNLTISRNEIIAKFSATPFSPCKQRKIPTFSIKAFLREGYPLYGGASMTHGNRQVGWRLKVTTVDLGCGAPLLLRGEGRNDWLYIPLTRGFDISKLQFEFSSLAFEKQQAPQADTLDVGIFQYQGLQATEIDNSPLLLASI